MYYVNSSFNNPINILLHTAIKTKTILFYYHWKKEQAYVFLIRVFILLFYKVKQVLHKIVPTHIRKVCT